MPMPKFEALKAEYARFWAGMIIRREAEAVAAAARLYKSRDIYQAVEKSCGVPWMVVAILHMREASGDFRGILHNGEDIIGTGKLTRLVPKGRGPFDTWAESADDALRMKGLDKIVDWTIERICYVAETYNGPGYRNRGVPSAYLWAGSNNYVSGKYVADHKWDPEAVDKQLGAMVVYKALLKHAEKASARPVPPPPDIEPPLPPEPRLTFWTGLIEAFRIFFGRK